MAEKVKMNVECMGQMCGNCPELTIEVNRIDLSDGYNECYVNHLRCAHLYKCSGIYSLIKDDWESHHVTRLEHCSK